MTDDAETQPGVPKAVLPIPLHARMGRKVLARGPRSVTTMELSDEVRGAFDETIHGGILATLADVTCALSTWGTYDDEAILWASSILVGASSAILFMLRLRSILEPDWHWPGELTKRFPTPQSRYPLGRTWTMRSNSRPSGSTGLPRRSPIITLATWLT